VATATSLIFVTAGTLAVAGSLWQIYEKVFHTEHGGLRGLYRLPVWTARPYAGAVSVEVVINT
jgi:hypothetical protein